MSEDEQRQVKVDESRAFETTEEGTAAETPKDGDGVEEEAAEKPEAEEEPEETE